MTPDELRERILRWEDPHTEFKQALGRTAEMAKDLVCFANADGGQIVIGVSPDREVVGVDDTDALMLQVDDVAFNLCSPPVTVGPEVVDLDGKNVLVLNIPKGDQRPYRTSDGRYYIRSGARCRGASREEMLRMFQATGSLCYDEQPLPRHDITELDLDQASRHAAESELSDFEDGLPRLLRSWGLYDGEHPTIAGIVLFGRRPQEILESSKVVIGALRGIDLGGDFIDRKDLSGGLFEVISQIESFLSIHLRRTHEVVGFAPEMREEIPFAALREAAVNALVHRDYTILGPVRIFVFGDRVEVRSPGRPPNTVNAEAMRAGVHVPRNPHIYSRVAASGLATRAGSGILRITRLLREHSGQDLQIEISDAEVILTLPRGGE
jgi:ATP-dependent DNA helicase RecG